MPMTGWHSCVVVSSVASEQQDPGFKSTSTLGSVECPCSLYASAGSPTVYAHAYCWWFEFGLRLNVNMNCHPQSVCGLSRVRSLCNSWDGLLPLCNFEFDKWKELDGWCIYVLYYIDISWIQKQTWIAIVTSIKRRCSESVWLSVHTQANVKHEKQVKCQWDTKQCLHLEGNPYHDKYKLPEGEEKKLNKKVVADSHCWRQLLESKTIKCCHVTLY